MKWRWLILLGCVVVLATCSKDSVTDQNNNPPTQNPPPTAADADNDGVADADDQCPETPANENVDESGCADSQKDSDGDGVNDAADQCPNTPEGEEVDENGCSDSQNTADADGDGIPDANDDCPNTPEGEEVDENGCSDSQNNSDADGDGDGVEDNDDECPDTPNGEEVDENGCSTSQLDSDGDGVTDDQDQCPDTPEGEDVDNEGCSESQKDDDQDGVSNADDQCPDTPADSEVNEEGCVEQAKTYVPDDGFEQALIDQGYDDVLDDYVLTSVIEKINFLEIDGEKVIGYEIKDLTGLEDFWNLRYLQISNCKLDKFELPTEIHLGERLVLGPSFSVESGYSIIGHPTMRALDIKPDSEGPHEISNNNMNRIYYDGVNTDMVEIRNNSIYSLFATNESTFNNIIIENNPNLGIIDFLGDRSGNWVGSLECNNNQRLYEFRIIANQLDNLRVENCIELKKISIAGNNTLEFPTLPLEGFPILEALYLESITLTSLDLSYNNNLSNFDLLKHDLKCVTVNQQQLNNIPSTWITEPKVIYSLSCD